MKNIAIVSSLMLFLATPIFAQPKHHQEELEQPTISSQKIQIDPNYKHQAGYSISSSSDHPVIKERENFQVYDQNYKHQAGKRKRRKENILTIKTEKGIGKGDNNYKHQFPSR
jgi:hypothetical protein